MDYNMKKLLSKGNFKKLATNNDEDPCQKTQALRKIFSDKKRVSRYNSKCFHIAANTWIKNVENDGCIKSNTYTCLPTRPMADTSKPFRVIFSHFPLILGFELAASALRLASAVGDSSPI